MDNLLEIKNLNKAIGSLKLTDINLTLEPGYIMGLIGRNGAGKTSLIKTILRLYQKDSGEVFINGHSMDTQERQAKDDIGFVLDESPFEDNLTVETNGKMCIRDRPMPDALYPPNGAPSGIALYVFTHIRPVSIARDTRMALLMSRVHTAPPRP